MLRCPESAESQRIEAAGLSRCAARIDEGNESLTVLEHTMPFFSRHAECLNSRAARVPPPDRVHSLSYHQQFVISKCVNTMRGPLFCRERQSAQLLAVERPRGHCVAVFLLGNQHTAIKVHIVAARYFPGSSDGKVVQVHHANLLFCLLIEATDEDDLLVDSQNFCINWNRSRPLNETALSPVPLDASSSGIALDPAGFGLVSQHGVIWEIAAISTLRESIEVD